MSTDIIQLVARLEADGSKFAGELNKAAKSVTEFADEAARSATDMASKIGTEASSAGKALADGVTQGTDKIAADIDTMAKAATEDLKGIGDSGKVMADEVAAGAEGIKEALGNEFAAGSEKAASEVEELKGDVQQDMQAIKGSVDQAAKGSEGTWRDANGRMRDANGKFVQGAKQGLQQVAQESKKSAHEMAENIAGAATKASVAMTAAGTAILGALVYAAKGALDFRNEMAGVFALLDKDVRTPQMVTGLIEGAQQIRIQYGITGNDMAEAMRVAIGSGIEAADATKFLADSAKAAVSGMVPLKDVVAVTAKTITAFGLESKDAQRVQDALAKAVNLGTVEWTDFANGLGQVVPFAKQSGLSVEELAGMIADLTLKGFPADQAMTSLKAALVGVQEPMPEAQAMFDRLGVKLRDADGKARPFLQILGDVKAKLAEKGVINIVDDKEISKTTKKLLNLKEKVADLNKEMAGAKTAKEKAGISKKLQQANEDISKTKKHLDGVMNSVQERLDKDGTVAALFGDVNAKAVGVAIMNDNMDGMNATLEKMKDSAGAVDEQFEGFTEGNRKFQIAQMTQQFQVMRETIGDLVVTAFAPLLKDLGELIKKTTEWVKANPEITKFLIQVGAAIGAILVVGGAIAGVVAAVAAVVAFFTAPAITAALAAIGGFIAAWAAPVLIVVAIIAAIAAGVYLIYKNWDGVSDFFIQCWEVIKGAFTAAWEWIKGIAMAIWTPIKDAAVAVWNGLVTYYQTQFNIIAGILLTIGKVLVAAFMAVFGPLLPYLQEAWDAIVEIFTAGWKWLVDGATKLWEGIVSAFTTGWNWVTGIVQQGWQAITQVWNAAVDVVAKALQPIFDAFVKGWEYVRGIFMKGVDTVVGFFKKIFDFMASGWEAAKAGPEQFSNWLIESIKNAVDACMEFLAGLWEKIKNLPGAVWDAVTGGAEGGGGTVPAFATGGIVRRPTVGLIGEAGPEAVIPLNGGAIPVQFPNDEVSSPGGHSSGGGAMPPINIYQQPGEDSMVLAKRVAEAIMMKRGYV